MSAHIQCVVFIFISYLNKHCTKENCHTYQSSLVYATVRSSTIFHRMLSTMWCILLKYSLRGTCKPLAYHLTAGRCYDWSSHCAQWLSCSRSLQKKNYLFLPAGIDVNAVNVCLKISTANLKIF